MVEPLARAFRPDVIVAQLGVDAHHNDPQTDLGLTLPGYRSLVRGIIGLADELCDGRLAALGGGGYHICEVVPLAWTWVMAELGGADLPEVLPEEWRARAPDRGVSDPPTTLGADDAALEVSPEQASQAFEATAMSVAETRSAVFPHHGLTP